MKESQMDKIIEEANIITQQEIKYTINGWKVILKNDVLKYFSETCTEGFEIEDEDMFRDLLKCHVIDDRCVEACIINNHIFTEETAIKAMEFLNNRDHYSSILRQYDPMKIVEKINWKIEPGSERHFIYVYVNLEVPTFYERYMNTLMTNYIERLKTECNEINIKSNDFKPLSYNWS